MYFGVDYYPEQWVYPYGGTAENPEAAWERDLELMAAAGVNVVRMGEFTWGLCEPEEGKYDFLCFLDRVVQPSKVAILSGDVHYGFHFSLTVYSRSPTRVGDGTCGP